MQQQALEARTTVLRGGRTSLTTEEVPTRGIHVDGEFRDATSGSSTAVVDPCSEEVLVEIPDGSAADVDLAVAAARRAFPDRKSVV